MIFLLYLGKMHSELQDSLTHFVVVPVKSPNIHFYINFQKKLEMVERNGKHKLVGFVELGEAHDHMEKKNTR